MPAIKAVLFDLDGTLMDTAPDLAAALNYVREQEHLPSLPLATIRPIASDGARGLLQCGFGIDHNDAGYSKLHDQLLMYYTNHVADQTTIFPGIESILQQLEQKHFPWGIVTNKPARFTEPLLKKLNLYEKTSCIVCGDTLSERKPHPAPLMYAAKLLKATPQQCCYIGDAERDIQAAKAAGMVSIVALYGYLHPHINPYDWQADYYINDVNELIGILDQ